jgi:hypothetical protein
VGLQEGRALAEKEAAAYHRRRSCHRRLRGLCLVKSLVAWVALHEQSRILLLFQP